MMSQLHTIIRSHSLRYNKLPEVLKGFTIIFIFQINILCCNLHLERKVTNFAM